MYVQLNEYFANFLSKYQWGFRQRFSSQHCLLVMIEKLRKIRDEKGVFASAVTDLYPTPFTYRKTKCLWF